MLKNFFNHIRLVNKADNPHLPLAFRAGKGICLILSLIVGIGLFAGAAPQHWDRECTNLPHMYKRDGWLYVNGQKVARDTRGHAGSCSGDAVWKDSRGRLYKNGDQLHRNKSAEKFAITRYSGDVIWKTSRDLFKNAEQLNGSGTSVQDYRYSDYTGDVAWKGLFNRLYKNGKPLSPSGTMVQRYVVAQYTGEVVWEDSFRELYKGKTKLGKAEKWQVANSGDVGWEDSYDRLYKNEVKVAESSERWQMRADGLLIWWDSSRNQHSR